MTSRTTITTGHNDGYLHKPMRNSRNSLIESQSKIQSPKSSKFNINTRLCTIKRENNAAFGFKITGIVPYKIHGVRKDGLAWKAGLRENDIVLKVNGFTVIDKQYDDVLNLIKRNSRVELLVESNSPNNVSQETNASPNLKPTSPIVIQNSKNDTKVSRPTPAPKPVPKPAPKPTPKPIQSVTVLANSMPTSESTLPKSSNYQSIIQRNNTQTKDPHTNKEEPDKYASSESSSDCSVTTSSAFSDSPKKSHSQTLPVVVSSPSIPINETPMKSNSYNAQSVISAPTKKVVSPPKKVSPEKLKNQTIPADGAKSYEKSMVDSRDKSSDQSNCNTLPTRKSGGLILGRDFDDDDGMDDEELENSLTLIKMLSSRESLSKPGLVAIILSYAKEKFEDMKIMIFYYVCKLYKSLTLRREFPTDAPRMANEIITTFFLEKSPLCLSIDIDIISDTIRRFRDGESFSKLFDAILIKSTEILKVIVTDVCGKIKRGIQLSEDLSFLLNAINTTMNQEKEINFLFRTMCNIFYKSQKDSNFNDTVHATQIGLASMYQFFHKSNFLPGASVRARSTDSLTNMTNQNRVQTISELFKINTLCAPYQSKVPQSIRKKTKTANGHVLIDVACQQPEECSVCEALLWGPSPQGLFCTMCSSYYHLLCKKKIKIQCSRKLRKSNIPLNIKEEKPPFFGRLSRKSSSNSIKGTNLSVSGDNTDMTKSVTDDKPSSALLDGNLDISKSQSEGHLNGTTTQDRFLFGSDMTGSFRNTSNEINDQGNVNVQELINEESLNDPDMRMEESFDAEMEISFVFPNINKDSNKKRLIVLLEFYHKTRYILMNLKRFWYILVQKWPASQEFYSKALSLDCIAPFVALIKSLVVTIERCITEQDFVGLEQSVLDWLSDNNDARLKEWITLSSNLCCTNSLNIVKQLKQTTLRLIPELSNLLKAKFHKMIIIEELTQIRPLLISLPLIVKNIIKCLGKLEPQYLDELTVWRQVSIKMDYLCEYIDRCCIPLVDWINDGSISKRLEPIDFPNKDIRDFCVDFPRTLFHFPIFDFQLAKIVTWSTNSKTTGADVRTNYFKKGTEVFLIFYKTFIVVLQKENDHWVLKPIKPISNPLDKPHPFIDIGSGIICNRGSPEENSYVLNIISNRSDTVLLLRIGFSRMEIVDSWLDYVTTRSYSLARSIALFKSADLTLMMTSSPQFERTPSNVSGKSKISQDAIDSTLTANIVPATNDRDAEDQLTNYMSIFNKLTNASSILESNDLLCSLLNVPVDSLSSHIKTVKDKGVNSIEELTVIFYTLSQAIIQNTQQLMAKGCPKIESSLEFDSDNVKSLLNRTCDILDQWQKSQKMNGEIVPEVIIRARPVSRREESAQALSGDVDLTIGSIVAEIIEDSMNGVDLIEIGRDSYKYVPTESLLPSIDNDDTCFLDRSEHISSNNNNDQQSPIEDTIVVSRAQIIVPKNKLLVLQ